jgi:membrane protease subunit HflK
MPDQDPWSPRRPQPDPLADILRLWDDIKSRLPRGGGPGRWRPNPLIFFGIALLVWAASGIYIVAPDQRGIVLRFGRVTGETAPGPHYHLPWPIEQVLRPSVTAIRKEEVGFRTVDVGPPARYQEIDAEALMLTGDDNIVKLEFIVQYKVRADATGTTDFLFNVRDPQQALRAAAEAAMREVIGRTEIDQALTEGKEVVQLETQRVLQQILDLYRAGIEIVALKLQDVDPPNQVSDAFKDVISAQQDREKLINESRGYANDVVPRARGQAAQILNEAEGYSAAKTRDATGVAQRFIALQEEYAKAEGVTRRRLYLETMEEILPGMNKIILDDLSAKQAVPYLPLEPFLLRRAEPAPERPAPTTGGGR